MKIILTICLVTIMMGTLSAQDDYKKFRVGLGLGYAMASGEGSKGGIIVDFEPGYRINDDILVNLRLESAAVVRGTTDDIVAGGEFDVAAIGSYTVNGQYYFRQDGFRPYAGLGLGIFSLAAVSVDGGGGDIAASSSEFGIYPRVGFDAGHFTFNIDFNILPNTEGAAGTEFKNSYIGFRIGGFFGGGTK